MVKTHVIYTRVSGGVGLLNYFLECSLPRSPWKYLGKDILYEYLLVFCFPFSNGRRKLTFRGRLSYMLAI